MKLRRPKARRLMDWAAANGWSCSLSRGGHLRFMHESGVGPVFCAATPSDSRSEKNAISLMRRMVVA